MPSHNCPHTDTTLLEYDMKYEFQEYHINISDSDLIEDLKKVKNILGFSSLSMAEYDKHGQYNSSTVSRRFGTWNEALAIAGIEPRNRFFDEPELFENIQRVWLSKGKQPVRRDMDDHPASLISSGAYKRHFGSWTQAMRTFVEYINRQEENDSNNVLLADSDGHRTKREINSRLRFLVLARDNFACRSCGASPAKDGGITRLHVDHIIPWVKGGETTPDNLQTLCEKCNLGKRDMLI